MIPEFFIRRWHAAGLIDDATAARIRTWETGHQRPVWLWAVAGVGALAIGLGIMAVIGANWEDIPAGVKLAADLALNIACAAVLFIAWMRKRAWLREIAALLLFALVLSGIALIGQVYQLQSDFWQPLSLWLLLCTPFLALLGRSQLVGAVWAIAIVTTWFAAAVPLHHLLEQARIISAREDYLDADYFMRLLVYLPACGMIVIGALRKFFPHAREQGVFLLRLGLAGLLATASLSMMFDDRPHDANWIAPAAVAALATLAAAASLWLERDDAGRLPTVTLIGASFVAWLAGLLVTGADGWTNDLLRAVLFILYWALVGGMAARLGHRNLFGLAFTVIGLRLLVLYFEAIGGLTATGFGLIGGGVLCLVLATVGWRLTRGVPRRPAKMVS